MSSRRGPAEGDRFEVVHTCSDHLGSCIAVLTAERVTPLSDASWWRVRSTRCDGSAIEFTVDEGGNDVSGDVLPVLLLGASQ